MVQALTAPSWSWLNTEKVTFYTVNNVEGEHNPGSNYSYTQNASD